MTLFILLAAVLTMAVLGLLIWAGRDIWRSAPASAAPGQTERNILNAELELLRVQRRELEQDEQSHRVDIPHRELALLDLSRRADMLLRRRQQLEKDEAPSVSFSKPAKPAVWPLLIAGLAVPLLAAGLYFKLGTPAALDPVRVHPSKDIVEVDGRQVNIKELLVRLEQKLNEQPDQAEGWMLLGSTKYKLGDFAGAGNAFRKASALAEQRPELKDAAPDILADLADAIVMQQGGRFDGEPQVLVERILKLNPVHQKGLALAAGAAMRANEPGLAMTYWQRLRDTLPAGSSARAEIEAVIADLSGGLNQDKDKKPELASVKVEGKVNLSSAFQDRVRDGDTLFVYARRLAGANASAPRMPLAVARFTIQSAGQFPQTFELTEAMAMAPGSSLADAGEAEITARISRSGNAIPASGDLVSAPVVVKPASKPKIELRIDRTVP